MTADDILPRLHDLRLEYGNLPLAFYELPGPQYSHDEGVEPAKGEPDFCGGKPCFIISYVAR